MRIGGLAEQAELAAIGDRDQALGVETHFGADRGGGAAGKAQRELVRAGARGLGVAGGAEALALDCAIRGPGDVEEARRQAVAGLDPSTKTLRVEAGVEPVEAG